MKTADDRPLVLIIDDDREYCHDLGAYIGTRCQVRFAASDDEGLGVLHSEPPDVVILDLYLEGGRLSLDLLRKLHTIAPEIQVIMVTAQPTAEMEAAAYEAGALYFISKASGAPEIRAKLAKCLEVGRTERRRASLLERLQRPHSVVMDGPAMRELNELVDRFAAAPMATVLITGETGVGKSAVAREIHRRSARAAGPFVHFAAGAHDTTLIANELFGHVPGAFANASSRKLGFVDAAEGGTLLLDDIHALQGEAQLRLLKLLEERRFSALGDHREKTADVRVIAGTSQDLGRLVREGRFSQELHGRLAVLTLDIPPLRKRREDIPALARFFLGQLRIQTGAPPEVTISDRAMERLVNHAWRGANVRELKNAMLRALTLHGHRGVLEPEHFDLADDRGEAPGPEFLSRNYMEERTRALRDFQDRFFRIVFAGVGGSVDHPNSDSVKRAAEVMGIATKTVWQILRELGKVTGGEAGEER